jgi:hypothetical protein
MDDRTYVDCILKINGNPRATKIAPYVCEYGFWLSNDAGGSREHFRLAPLPGALDTLLRAQCGQPFSVDVNDTELGSVDENRGYAANDMGPVTRPIAALTFGLRHADGVSHFQFTGRTGHVDYQTVFAAGGLGPAGVDDTYQFEIEFDIRDEDLPIYFVNATALGAVKAYIQASGSSEV